MEQQPHHATGLAFGGLIVLAAAMGIGRFVYTPILPFMIADLGLSKADAGVIASANFLGYLLGALAASATGLPGSKRAWFLGALLISAATTGAMALTSSVAVFLALRFVGGVASAFVLVFASALVLERLAVARRSGLAAVHFAGVGTGIAVSAVLVAALAAAGLGWRGQWLASGSLSLLALIAAFRLIPPAPDGAGTARPNGGVGSGLVALITAYGLFGFGYVITATFISTLVSDTPALQSVESTIWLVVGLAAIPSVALWTAIGQWLGNARSFAIACVAEAVGVALSVLADSAFEIIAAGALLGGTFMGITALGLVHARSLSTGDPRRSLALMTAAFGLGQMIGPTFAGFLYDRSGSLLLPSLVAAGALLVAAALVLAPRPSAA